MVFSENGSAVPAPLVAAHSALHPVSFQASITPVGSVNFGTAFGTDLKVLTPVARLEILFACNARMLFIVANKADRLTTYRTHQLFFLKIFRHGFPFTVEVGAAALQRF